MRTAQLLTPVKTLPLDDIKTMTLIRSWFYYSSPKSISFTSLFSCYRQKILSMKNKKLTLDLLPQTSTTFFKLCNRWRLQLLKCPHSYRNIDLFDTSERKQIMGGSFNNTTHPSSDHHDRSLYRLMTSHPCQGHWWVDTDSPRRSISGLTSVQSLVTLALFTPLWGGGHGDYYPINPSPLHPDPHSGVRPTDTQHQINSHQQTLNYFLLMTQSRPVSGADSLRNNNPRSHATSSCHCKHGFEGRMRNLTPLIFYHFHLQKPTTTL